MNSIGIAILGLLIGALIVFVVGDAQKRLYEQATKQLQALQNLKQRADRMLIEAKDRLKEIQEK